jgi:hypothetical protein
MIAMPTSTKPSFTAYTALIYVTVGALIAVWTGLWYWFLTQNPPQTPSTWYWCYGLLATGLTLLIIGLTMGWIVRSARQAELPPKQVTPAAAKAEQSAAAGTPATAGNGGAQTAETKTQSTPTGRTG